jgi:molybdopterin synthase catalytic subunit
MIKITEERVDAGILIEDAKRPELGAIATFTGIVRDDGIERIELESYSEAAVMEIEKIRDEALERFPISSVDVVHRIGPLFIGDTILVIVVGAGHRKEATSACEYILERIKQTVPIWKKEFRKDGEQWVRGDYPKGFS